MAIGVAATTAALVAASAAAARSLTAFQAFETQQLTLNGVLRATGGAAGKTAADIEGMAQSIAAATLASTTGVRQAAGQLLTFRSISGETFERTLTLAQDLAALGFGSISSASVQLGKALEDPIRGVSALAEVGVSFSASQREVIRSLVETGRAAEAQRLILDAVEQQVGGAGSAAAGGLAGAYDSLGQAVDNHLVLVGEQIAKYSLLREGILGIANAINETNDGLRPATTAERLSGVNSRIGAAQGRLAAPSFEPSSPLPDQLRDSPIRASRDTADETILNQLYEERAELLRKLRIEFTDMEAANIASSKAAKQAAEDQFESVRDGLQQEIKLASMSEGARATLNAQRKAGVIAASEEGAAIADLVGKLQSEVDARKRVEAAGKSFEGYADQLREEIAETEAATAALSMNAAERERLPREETRIISSGDSTWNVAVRRTPRSEMKMEIARDGSVVAASHITRSGVLFYTKHKLVDLPNDLVSVDDLEGLGINLVDVAAAR